MAAVRCEKIENKEKRHQCFRKKCFREIYDYNARAIVKTRFPTAKVDNYYAFKRSSSWSKFYEDILDSYYKWLKFSELRGDVDNFILYFGGESDYRCSAVFDDYIAVATNSQIIIFKNFRREDPIDLPSALDRAEELRFGFYPDEYDYNQIYLAARIESGNLLAWNISDRKIIETPKLRDDDPRSRFGNLCFGTAKNFYLSDELIINKYQIRNQKMEIESSIALPVKNSPRKKVTDGMQTRSEKIVALESNDMNIYAVTCRVDKNLSSKEEKIYLERYVCEDVRLICTRGGVAYDRKYSYEPLPKEFNSKTKVYLTMEDFIICTCGKYIAVYDDPVNSWVVSELITDDEYVETLIVHANLLLLGFNSGKIFGYDVSILQSVIKPNFFNGAKFRILGIKEPIVEFNVFEQKIDDELKMTGETSVEIFYPYILIVTKKSTYKFKFTENYANHFRDNKNNPPAKVMRCGVISDDHFTFITK